MRTYHQISKPEPPEPPPGGNVQQPPVSEPTIGPVNFSLDPDGIYASPQTLLLSCDTPGALVRYAFGAETVSAGDLIFDPAQPLILTSSTQIAAQAFTPETVGPLGVATYTIQSAIWQKREPEDQSDPAPHEVQETTTLQAGWQLAAASARGKLHAHRALWREDAFTWSEAGSWTITVVSDGAGSAPLSRVGSELACHSARQCLEIGLAEWQINANSEAELKARDLPLLRQHLVDAARAALEAVRSEAGARGRAANDFAATLLIFVKTSWQASELFAALQVGDGIVALYNSAEDLTLLGVADHGEHSSETRFLTTAGIEADLPNRVVFSLKAGIQAVAVMTDGISDDFFPEDKRLGELFESVLPQLSGAEDAGVALLKWIGYEKKGSSDDRTLLVLWRTATKTSAFNPDSEFSHDT